MFFGYIDLYQLHRSANNGVVFVFRIREVISEVIFCVESESELRIGPSRQDFEKFEVMYPKNQVFWQPTVPPQTDSTHGRSYTTYSTHNSSSTGLLLYKRGPIRSCHVWHRQTIQHEAFLHMLRYSTRRYCTALNSPQTDFTRPRFNTTRFYISVFLHKAGPAPPFPVSAHEYTSGR